MPTTDFILCIIAALLVCVISQLTNISAQLAKIYLALPSKAKDVVERLKHEGV